MNDERGSKQPNHIERHIENHIEIVDACLRGRRTVHDFLPKPPPRSVLMEALDLARWAPNHRLTHPFRFHLLGRRSIERVAGLNARLVREQRGEEAARKKLARWLEQPGWLVVTASVCSDDVVRHQEDYAATACAIQNLALALWVRGIGMKWTSGPVIRSDEFHRILGLDEASEYAVALVWYGYPAQVPEAKRPPLEEYVRELD